MNPTFTSVSWRGCSVFSTPDRRWVAKIDTLTVKGTVKVTCRNERLPKLRWPNSNVTKEKRVTLAPMKSGLDTRFKTGVRHLSTLFLDTLTAQETINTTSRQSSPSNLWWLRGNETNKLYVTLAWVQSGFDTRLSTEIEQEFFKDIIV